MGLGSSALLAMSDTLRAVRIAVSLIAMVLLITGPAACGDDGPATGAVDCGDVGFTPHTDDGAFDIAATGVSCERARRVATRTRTRRDADPLSYEADGFSCTGTRISGDGLPGVAWRCTRNGNTITFTRN